MKYFLAILSALSFLTAMAVILGGPVSTLGFILGQIVLGILFMCEAINRWDD